MTLATPGESSPPNQFIVHSTDNIDPILQRVSDGYINATALCKATGKLFADYKRNTQTQAFWDAMERSMGIPIDLLVQTVMVGANEQRGTWVHPHIAINLAQWASADFAVQVSIWVTEWMQGKHIKAPKPGDNAFELIIRQATAALELEKRQIVFDLRLTSVEQEQGSDKIRLEEIEAKMESVAGGSGCFTIKGYGRLKGLSIPLSLAKKLGKEATKMCQDRHLSVGTASDEVHGRINTYPEEILSLVFFDNNLTAYN